MKILHAAKQFAVSGYRFWILFLIVVLGGVVRLWGNSFGLPYLYHPDEGALVMPALKILHTGNLNPGRYDWGSVSIYILFFVYIFYFLAGARQGVFQVVQDIPYYDDLLTLTRYEFPAAYVVARSVSALFGVGSILLTYLLAKRLFGAKVGVVAGLLVALFPPLVLDAHYATADTALVFFILLVTYLSVKLYERGDPKYYLLAGFAAGIAISTKYAFTSIVIPVAAHVLRNWRTRPLWDTRLFFLTLSSIVAGFLVGTPFAILDFTTFLNYMARLLRIYGRPGSSPPLEPTYLWWVKHMFTMEIWPLTILSLLGLGYLLWREPRKALLLSAFPVLTWILLLSQTTRYPRLWLPMAPIMMLFAAYALVRFSEYISAATRPLRANLLLAALLLPLVCFWGFVAAQYDWRMTQTEVRTAALAWAEENLPADSRVAVDLGGPPLSSSMWDVAHIVRLAYYPLEWYQDQGFDYLVISQPAREEPNLTQRYEENYDSIESGAELIGDLKGYLLHMADQHLWVYKVVK